MKQSQVNESFRDYEGFCRSTGITPTYEGYKLWIKKHLKN